MKQNDFKFTEENIAMLFGSEAAEDEEINRLRNYYYKNKTHEKVTANLPLRILVGHKGIGKSAIFTVARYEDIENNRLSILIQPNDIAGIGRGDVSFLQRIAEWKQGLLSIIAEKVMENLGVFCETDSFREYLNSGGKFLTFLYKLFQNKIDELGDGTDTTAKIIAKFLNERKVIVYLDDLDRGWEGKKQDTQRISALLNAARDLSRENIGLQFRISLRTDVYYLVRTSDESTDKIESSVIWHSWTNHEIFVLLIKRIESFFGREINVESLIHSDQKALSSYLDQIFEKRFNDYGKWSNAPIYRVLMSLIRKRPRDLVKLCTLAAKEAADNSSNIIKTEHLKKIFPEYSQGRIQDTVNEYRSELPDIERLLLNMKPSEKEKKSGIGYRYDSNGIKMKITSIEERGKFYFSNGKQATSSDLLQFLYKINFLTARKTLSDGRIDRKYFEENKYLSSSITDFGYEWEIHPAFRWALDPTETSVRDIDLSEE